MYVAPLTDIRAALYDMTSAASLPQTALFAEASADIQNAMLAEAAKLFEQEFAPLNQPSDTQGAQLTDGQVRATPGFSQAYAKFVEAGLAGLTAPEAYGGMGMPLTLGCAINEMAASACLSLSLCPLLSQSAIEALSHHATPEQKELYLPKLAEGVWTGAMALTEPQAGTDVGALITRAQPMEDGSFSVTGGKIWISWGDHDMAQNVVHLVLARLPDAPPGVKGISLFVIPKFLPTAEGGLGARNSFKPVSLDHKMGLHGSPTCVMAYEGAKGWLVGAPHQGMRAMFTMMNNARLGVGIEGVGVAEMATQRAFAFANERVQGRTPLGDGPILHHADVRRMLLKMKTQTLAARALAYECAAQLDLARAAATEQARAQAMAMGAFLTPIAKAFGTDTGCEVANLGVQAHGGAGYVEETGAAQYLRDVRVTAIYEGTNGVQAMDLVGRKLNIDNGAAAQDYLRSAQAAAQNAPQPLHQAATLLSSAAQAAQDATSWMLHAEANDRAAGCVSYLRALALVGGGAHLIKAATSPTRAAQADFFLRAFAPEAVACAQSAQMGAAPLYAAPADAMLAP